MEFNRGRVATGIHLIPVAGSRVQNHNQHLGCLSARGEGGQIGQPEFDLRGKSLRPEPISLLGGDKIRIGNVIVVCGTRIVRILAMGIAGKDEVDIHGLARDEPGESHPDADRLIGRR